MPRFTVFLLAFLFSAFSHADIVSLSAKEIICRSDTIVLAKADSAYLSGRINDEGVEEVVVQFDVKKRWLGKPPKRISLVSLPTMGEEPTFVVGLEYVLFLVKNKWVLYKVEVIFSEFGLALAPDDYNEVKFRLSDLGNNIASTKKQCKLPYEETPPLKSRVSPETKQQTSHSCKEVSPFKTVVCSSTHIAIGKVIEATSLERPEDATNLKVVMQDYWCGSGEKIIALKYFPKKDKRGRLIVGRKYLLFMQEKNGEFVIPNNHEKPTIFGDINTDAIIYFDSSVGCPSIKELSQYKSEVLKISHGLCKQAKVASVGG